ncbi:hypothetical protein SAMN05428989_0164 [Pseudoxanthomonas sp. GM95]|uniref:hypothetical protein n=1 Tax=Pseudoxanthomonas sp. GM95 TaxID=1881043 RepID=UPI0008D2ADCD|nr:hypothetical protein [Pseudoxanthomonas sp. GM95]SEK46402.1 hypothetical protein SAMN05428989_0164 [Pseudoxanthomonas sp. GM95]
MRKTFLAAVLVAMPFAASAADLPMSYTFVEAGYTQVKLDDDFLDDPSLDGGYIRGSVAIAESAYVFGSWAQASKTYRYDGLKLKVTLDQPEAGIGYHMPFTDRLDFIADLAYVRLGVKAKASLDGASATESDHVNVGRVSAGVRGKPSARTELWLKAGYFDGSDLDEGKFVGTFGGQVSFTQTWGLVGEVQVYDGATQASVGVRASF